MPLLIISPNDEVRNQELEKLLKLNNVNFDHPDVLLISEKLGIEQVKKIRSHLSWKPALAAKRIVVINPADSLTSDAQNGLLKILEEPSDNALIFLGAAKEDSLYPTILSRCQIQVLENKVYVNYTEGEFINSLIEKSTEERLESLEKIEDRKKLLPDLFSYYHQILPENPNYAAALKSLLAAEQWIKQNVAAKAITDFLMLVLPKAPK